MCWAGTVVLKGRNSPFALNKPQWLQGGEISKCWHPMSKEISARQPRGQWSHRTWVRWMTESVWKGLLVWKVLTEDVQSSSPPCGWCRRSRSCPPAARSPGAAVTHLRHQHGCRAAGLLAGRRGLVLSPWSLTVIPPLLLLMNGNRGLLIRSLSSF